MPTVPSFLLNINRNGKIGLLFFSHLDRFFHIKVCWDEITLDVPCKYREDFLRGSILHHYFNAHFDSVQSHMCFETSGPSVARDRSFNSNTFMKNQFSVLYWSSNIFLNHHMVNRHQKLPVFQPPTLQSFPTLACCFSLSSDAQPHQHKDVGFPTF